MLVEEITVDLIFRKIREELNEDEERVFQAWLAESPKHEAYFSRMKRYEEACSPEDVSVSEVEEAWRDLGKRVDRYRKKKRYTLFYRYTAIAASVLILFGSIWMLRGRQSIPTTEKEEVIMPGKYNAVLELADGRVYNLQDLPKEQSVEIPGHIALDSCHLDYTGLDTFAHIEAQYHALTVPRGGEYQIVLQDGSKVWLNSDSRLRYPEKFSDTIREVYLEGEAYFEVVPQPDRPFIVYADKQKLTVLGTSFGVTNYAEEQLLSATLVKGRIKVEYPDLLPQTFTLEPGNRVLCNLQTGLVEQQAVDVREFVAWKDGRYVFMKKRLEDILTTLSRWYDFQVFYQNQEAREVLFSGELMRFGSFKELLSIIEKSSDVRFNIKDRVVMVSQ